MDIETGAVLSVQILALCSIVGALLAYLMHQTRNANIEFEMHSKRHVLVTSCDTCVGLQFALALSEAGYKVFAGLLEPNGNSHAAKILRTAKLCHKRNKDLESAESSSTTESRGSRGAIVPLELDSTREDSLHACLDAIRAKLPAGEDGLWAVVHTGGLALPGIIERQSSSAWESMLRHNLVAPLRTARVFIPLLRAKRGRIILLGDSDYGTKAGTGLVAFSASRKAVEGAAEALRTELASSGVDVVLLKPSSVNPLSLYSPPTIKTRKTDPAIEAGIAQGIWEAPLPDELIKYSLIPALRSTCPYQCYDMNNKIQIFFR